MFYSMCLDGNGKNETALRRLNFVGIKFVSDGGSDRGEVGLILSFWQCIKISSEVPIKAN